MEVTGKIIFDLGLQTGTSKAGNQWKKHEYVLETKENFPRKVHFDFFGDKADQYILTPGQEVTISFDIESREYNGRWYTSIRAWKAEAPNAAAAPAVAQSPAPTYGAPAPGVVPPPSVADIPAAGPTDDLPF